MYWILSIKHWQLFLLVVVCGIVKAPGFIEDSLHLVSGLSFFTWLFAIGFYGQIKITKQGLVPMNINLFIFNFAFILAFILFTLIFVPEDAITDSSNLGLTDILFMIAGFYMMFAIFQSIVFVCKMMAKLEYNREVSLGDYATSLFLFFFFFVGVWIFQPKVNKAFSNS